VPVRLWSATADIASALTDRSERQPSKRKLMLIRVALMAVLLIFAPLLMLLSLRWTHMPAFDALKRQVHETWRSSAYEAVDLLRSTYQQLVAKGAIAKMKRVEIAPFGKFDCSQAICVHQFLYDCEIAIGNFEGALAVASSMPGRLDDNVLRQVDCLVALGRRAEAIALLERNLDLDGWRGKLRRRLVELGGRPSHAVN
jgi:hypothetical protein